MKTLGCAMVLALWACGSGAGDRGDGGGEPAADAGAVPASSEPLPCAPCTDQVRYDYEGAGRYEVPLSLEHGHLVEAAVTPVSEAQLRVDSGELSLSYQFPVELAGVAQEVDFDGPLPAGNGPLVLSGSAGTATCQVSDVSGDSFAIYCFEELPGVQVDVAALETLLEGRGLEPALIEAHLEVAELFSEDPIGIFYGTLRADGG